MSVEREPDTETAVADVEPMQLTIPRMGFRELVWSDYLVYRTAPEPRWKARLLWLPRMLANPSLQFALLVRVAQCGPTVLQYPVRLLQVWLFSSEIYWFNREQSVEIGPGISFPHPINIIIGPATRIGSDVLIYNNTNIGANRSFEPGSPDLDAAHIGDRAVIYGYSVVQGRYDIGHDAVVGVRVMVDGHVPPGALQTVTRLRRRGEWPGLSRPSDGA